MTFKASYLFWLIMAVAAGAWPLAMSTAHSIVEPKSAAIVTSVDA